MGGEAKDVMVSIALLEAGVAKKYNKVRGKFDSHVAVKKNLI